MEFIPGSSSSSDVMLHARKGTLAHTCANIRSNIAMRVCDMLPSTNYWKCARSQERYSLFSLCGSSRCVLKHVYNIPTLGRRETKRAMPIICEKCVRACVRASCCYVATMSPRRDEDLRLSHVPLLSHTSEATAAEAPSIAQNNGACNWLNNVPDLRQRVCPNARLSSSFVRVCSAE